MSAMADLMGALKAAERRLSVVADLLEKYPRPSQDPNGRLLLDAREIAKESAFAARAAIATAEAAIPASPDAPGEEPAARAKR